MGRLKSTWLREIFITVVSCIVVFAGLWAYDTWASYRQAHVPVVPPKPVAQAGSHMAVEGVDFSRSPLTLLLISSPTCQYCLASEHFHTKLFDLGRTEHVPIYVAVPSREKARQYLGLLGVDDVAVKEYAQMNLSASGTPTILAINNRGEIKEVWSGLANPADELNIANLVQSKKFSSGALPTGISAPNFSQSDLQKERLSNHLELLNVAERGISGSEQGEQNIPLQELPLRLSYEVDKEQLHVVDCTNIAWRVCESAVTLLNKSHVRTATLGAGSLHLRCKVTPVGS